MTIKQLAERFIDGKKFNTMHDYTIYDDWRINGKLYSCRTWYNDGDPVACIYRNTDNIWCVYIPDSKYYYINLKEYRRTDISYYNRRQLVYFNILERGVIDYIQFCN